MHDIHALHALKRYLIPILAEIIFDHAHSYLINSCGAFLRSVGSDECVNVDFETLERSSTIPALTRLWQRSLEDTWRSDTHNEKCFFSHIHCLLFLLDLPNSFRSLKPLTIYSSIAAPASIIVHLIANVGCFFYWAHSAWGYGRSEFGSAAANEANKTGECAHKWAASHGAYWLRWMLAGNAQGILRSSC